MLPADSMIHYHVFWAKPHLGRQGHGQSLELVDLELLIWITSALEIRKHSPMHLITDADGAAFFRDSGLAWIYDQIHTHLDEIPDSINPAIFWDGGKMFAFQHLETPCVVLDYDAILWQPLKPNGADVVALHEEERQWSFYAPNRELFERFGFESGEWNWEVNPVNTGLVFFSEPELPRSMGARSVEFMKDYSKFAENADESERLTEPKYNRATLFAGQRLLAMCADQRGCSLDFLVRLHPELLTLEKNPQCSHFWISKVLYRCIPEARVPVANHLINYLKSNHPETEDSLADFGLNQPLDVHPERRMNILNLSPRDQRRRKLRRVEKCTGDVLIEDANLDVFRKARQGMLVLPGEQIHLKNDGSCELEPAEAYLTGERT